MTTSIEQNRGLQEAPPPDLQYCQEYFERLFHSNFFKCLNDETRQRIILLAGRRREEGMRVAEIAEHFDLDRTTVSHHLAMLRENNLVTADRRGKERYYSVNIDYILGALDEVSNILRSCCK